jgi:hypothetical protein
MSVHGPAVARLSMRSAATAVSATSGRACRCNARLSRLVSAVLVAARRCPAKRCMGKAWLSWQLNARVCGACHCCARLDVAVARQGWLGAARLGAQGNAVRHRVSLCVGKARPARLVSARPGMAASMHCLASLGAAVPSVRDLAVSACPVSAWLSNAGLAWQGMSRPLAARLGSAQPSWQ